MKYILILLTALSIGACSNNLDELNENIKVPETVPGEALFTSAQKNLVDQMTSTSVNSNIFRLVAQHWTETVYTDETNYELNGRNIPQNYWRALYRDVLKNLDQATIEFNKITPSSPAEEIEKNNKIQITEVLKIYTYAVLVDTFGNVPYSEALNIENKSPKYDDALTIYKDLLLRLDGAINNLNKEGTSFDVNDNIYQGDSEKWFKFANSLKLRLALTLSYVPSEAGLAKTYATEALPNIFQSNADSALFTYLGATPNTNQLFAGLVASGRNDFIPANTLVDFLNKTDDPRRKYFFDENIKSPQGDIIYKGGVYGALNSFPSFTYFDEQFLDPTAKATIFDYTEVQFLLAEASAKGLIGSPSDAENYYNEAITSSILYWGGTETEVQAYLSNPLVAYATSGATWQEKIGNQAWIGLYNRGFEAWNTWKRVDFPKLVAPEDARSEIPVRFTYPINEQTLNASSYKSASNAIGGDTVETKLFWDQN